MHVSLLSCIFQIKLHGYLKVSFPFKWIFQARLEELQAQKQEVVTQKEAADDENRKLVSAKCSFYNKNTKFTKGANSPVSDNFVKLHYIF